MDIGKGSECSSNGQGVASSSRKGKNNRHTDHQLQVLEEYFKECPHPDEKQRRRLGMELGLDPQQIRYWFQNKRTQTKNQHDRADNYTLRIENEKILCENLAYKEVLKNMICKTCRGPSTQEDDQQTTLQKLHMEHLQLREQYNKLCGALTAQLGKPLSEIDARLNAYTGSVLDVSSSRYTRNQGSGTSLAQQVREILGTTNDFRVEMAAKALKELVMLLQTNGPFWIKSSCGKYTLDHENYDRIFSRASHYKNPNSRIESSRDSKDVNISAMDLISMFSNPEQWAHSFCTIVRQAKSIEVINMETSGQQNDHLQLMYAQMHILSPLVAPREFCFLRCCKLMEAGVWIVADVSYDYAKEDIPPSRSWRFPSGCMIQEMSNGFSRVTWVEHVEVDDKNKSHRLYREVLGAGFAYGAEKWTSALQRMGERLNGTIYQNMPILDYGGALDHPEAKRNIMKLSHRMVKNFCSMLAMSTKLDFPHVADADTSGVRMSVSKNTELGQPNGTIISAATSLWLPLSLDAVFRFLTDENTRNLWDVLFRGDPVQKVASINTANQPGNFISVIMPTTPNDANKLMLQECSMDNQSAVVVQAPIEIPSFNMAVAGEDTATIPLLPSGFTIIDEGLPSRTSTRAHPIMGSILTVAIQLVVNGTSTSERVNADSIANVNTIISAMALKIKLALNCGGSD